MIHRIGLVALILCVAAPAVNAQTIVDLDSVFASAAGTTVFSDDFNDGVLAPEWLTFGTTPGPESGTVLRMDAGDFILRVVGTEPSFTSAAMNLTQFPAGSGASLILSAPGGDRLTLTVESALATFSDELGQLGSLSLDPGSVAMLSVVLGANGVIATVNGDTIYSGARTLDGQANTVGVSVVPEPATIGLLGLGLCGLLRRRRSSQA